jgi:tetratricopeptide (TPR) repeat protein
LIATFGIALLLQPAATDFRKLFEQNLAQAEQQYGMANGKTAAAARDLGLFLRNHNDAPGAYRALAEAVSVDEKTTGADSQQTIEDIAALASVAPTAEAVTLWQRVANGPDAALASKAFAALAELAEHAGDRAQAAAMYRNALEKEESANGKDSSESAVLLNALALASEPPVAVPLLERAVAIDRKRWGEKHPETATAESNLSGELLALGRVSDAVRIGALALSNFEATLGPEHPRTAAAASNLADAERAAGNRATAERLYRRALSIDEQAYGAANDETRNDAKNLADFLREIGRARDAAVIEQHYAIGAPAR